MAQGQHVPAVGEDVTALMRGAADQASAQHSPGIGDDVTALMNEQQQPDFRTSNEIDVYGNPVIAGGERGWLSPPTLEDFPVYRAGRSAVRIAGHGLNAIKEMPFAFGRMVIPES